MSTNLIQNPAQSLTYTSTGNTNSSIFDNTEQTILNQNLTTRTSNATEHPANTAVQFDPGKLIIEFLTHKLGLSETKTQGLLRNLLGFLKDLQNHIKNYLLKTQEGK